MYNGLLSGFASRIDPMRNHRDVPIQEDRFAQSIGVVGTELITDAMQRRREETLMKWKDKNQAQAYQREDERNLTLDTRHEKERAEDVANREGLLTLRQEESEFERNKYNQAPGRESAAYQSKLDATFLDDQRRQEAGLRRKGDKPDYRDDNKRFEAAKADVKYYQDLIKEGVQLNDEQMSQYARAKAIRDNGGRIPDDISGGSSPGALTKEQVRAKLKAKGESDQRIEAYLAQRFPDPEVTTEPKPEKPKLERKKRQAMNIASSEVFEDARNTLGQRKPLSDRQVSKLNEIISNETQPEGVRSKAQELLDEHLEWSRKQNRFPMLESTNPNGLGGGLLNKQDIDNVLKY